MSTTTKKAYVYKMNLVPANVLGVVIFIVLLVFSYLIKADMLIDMNLGVLFLIMLLYLAFHEFLHGVGYLLGGTKRKNISYGIALEKGILYCMAYQELTKKNILISLQMPFMVIGVITYIIGYFFHIPVLVWLSIVNLIGASMDLMMFMYIMRIKDVIYSESGEPDEFVLISSEDLTKKKSIYFKIVDTKEYKKSDYQFKDVKKISISKTSYIVLGILIVVTILSII